MTWDDSDDSYTDHRSGHEDSSAAPKELGFTCKLSSPKKGGNICGRIFDTKIGLTTHQNAVLHYPKRLKFICDECKKKCVSASGLKRHQNKAHCVASNNGKPSPIKANSADKGLSGQVRRPALDAWSSPSPLVASPYSALIGSSGTDLALAVNSTTYLASQQASILPPSSEVSKSKATHTNQATALEGASLPRESTSSPNLTTKQGQLPTGSEIGSRLPRDSSALLERNSSLEDDVNNISLPDNTDNYMANNI